MALPSYKAGFEKFGLALNGGAKELKCAIWYPTDWPESDVGRRAMALLGRRRPQTNAWPVSLWRLCPMVPSGSSWREHHDTAEVLARRGFVVAALSHLGDSCEYGDEDFNRRLRQARAGFEIIEDF